jgi:hypothetical protein
VRQPSKSVPDIMHLDGTYVKMQKVTRATQPRKKCSKETLSVKVVHTGFFFMRLESPIVKSGRMRDALAKRMRFNYDQQHVTA